MKDRTDPSIKQNAYYDDALLDVPIHAPQIHCSNNLYNPKYAVLSFLFFIEHCITPPPSSLKDTFCQADNTCQPSSFSTSSVGLFYQLTF